MKLSIPIQRTTAVLIGDIYVNCKVQFRPQLLPQNMEEQITIQELNNRLQVIGHQIAAEMTDRVERAIKGMLPHTKLGDVQRGHVFVYAGSEHPHAAQKPVELKVRG